MKRGYQVKRAIMLVELMGAVTAGTAVLGVIAVALGHTMKLQRASAAYLDRQAVVAALTRQLREDAGAASAWRRDASQIVLETQDHAGRAVVAYCIGPEAVTRRVEDGQEYIWRARDLSFSSQVESGTFGDVLTVNVAHVRQSGATGVTTASAHTFLLPKERVPAP